MSYWFSIDAPLDVSRWFWVPRSTVYIYGVSYSITITAAGYFGAILGQYWNNKIYATSKPWNIPIRIIDHIHLTVWKKSCNMLSHILWRQAYSGSINLKIQSIPCVLQRHRICNGRSNAQWGYIKIYTCANINKTIIRLLLLHTQRKIQKIIESPMKHDDTIHFKERRMEMMM